MAQIGRPRKYGSAKALREAVDGYWDSISYQVPAVVSTPTGEVDDDGRVLYKSKLLTERMDGGKPKTVVKYLEPPSVPGLLLYLGISKSTWSAYRADERLGSVVAYWDARYEAYLVDRLETGKHIAGVMFNLEHNFHWKHRQEVGMDKETRKVVTASGMTMEEKKRLLEEAARDFAGERTEETDSLPACGLVRNDREPGTQAEPSAAGPPGRGGATE